MRSEQQPLSEPLAKKMVMLVKLVLVTSSKDSANLDSMVSLGLEEYLLELLQWNNPVEPSFNL
jgi:hypothetical protein